MSSSSASVGKHPCAAARPAGSITAARHRTGGGLPADRRFRRSCPASSGDATGQRPASLSADAGRAAAIRRRRPPRSRPRRSSARHLAAGSRRRFRRRRGRGRLIRAALERSARIVRARVSMAAIASSAASRPRPPPRLAAPPRSPVMASHGPGRRRIPAGERAPHRVDGRQHRSGPRRRTRPSALSTHSAERSRRRTPRGDCARRAGPVRQERSASGQAARRDRATGVGPTETRRGRAFGPALVWWSYAS